MDVSNLKTQIASLNKRILRLEEIRAANFGSLDIKLDALLKLEVETTKKRMQQLEAHRLRLSVHAKLALRTTEQTEKRYGSLQVDNNQVLLSRLRN